MSVEQEVLAALDRWRPAGDGPHEWHGDLPGTGWALTLTVDRADALSAAYTSVALERAAPADANLEAWAKGIAGRASGLLEPLTLHEIDAGQNVALLRSQAPSVRGDGRLYYELRLDGVRRATLKRYRGSAAGPREAVAFTLTHEVVAKLAGDVAGA